MNKDFIAKLLGARVVEMSDDEFDKSMNCGGTPDELPCKDKTCAHYTLCKAITGGGCRSDDS